MNGPRATRSKGLGHRAEDSQVVSQFTLLYRAWRSGWTRVLNAMPILQRAGEVQDIREKVNRVSEACYFSHYYGKMFDKAT